MFTYDENNCTNAATNQLKMSNEETIRDYSLEKDLQRAKWFKEDLDKGGWREIHKGPNVRYWIKTFPDEEVPVKVLFTHDMPISAKKYSQLYDPLNMEYRKKWDLAFMKLEVLEQYPDNGGYLLFGRKKFNWPIADREFVMFAAPHAEIDWYGKKSVLIAFKDAWHPLKPANEGGTIRATNGGNFFVVTPDDDEPETACKVFALTNNNFNGWIPNSVEWLISRKAPSSFNTFRESVINGYKKYAEELEGTPLFQ